MTALLYYVFPFLEQKTFNLKQLKYVHNYLSCYDWIYVV